MKVSLLSLDSLLVVSDEWNHRVCSTVQTYPSTLLWEAFTAPAAVSSSTWATVLLSTLSDTKTDMTVRAGRGEVSRQTPHKHRTPAFRNFHLVCTNTDMHWMHVLVVQCMLGHSEWWTVSVCDQLWSVIHLFMQPAVVHECGKLWHSCVYCCGLQKGSFGSDWVTVWRSCSLEKTGTPIDEDNFNFGCLHTSGTSRPHCPICAGCDTQSATDQCRHSLIKGSSQKIGLFRPEGQKCQDPERAEIAGDANWGGVKETFVLFWASIVHTDPAPLQLLNQCCRTDAHEMLHGIEPSLIQVILSRCSLVPFDL